MRPDRGLKLLIISPVCFSWRGNPEPPEETRRAHANSTQEAAAVTDDAPHALDYKTPLM